MILDSNHAMSGSFTTEPRGPQESMTMDTAAAIAVLEALPPDERVEIASRLMEGAVDDGWQPKPSEALMAELRRRVAAYEADPSAALTWEQVVASIKRSS